MATSIGKLAGTETLLDQRLKAASRSDNPEILRNTITALTSLRGTSWRETLVALLISVIRRSGQELPGESRYLPLLSHTRELLGTISEDDQVQLQEEIQNVPDKQVRVALEALLPRRTTANANVLTRWLAARSRWPVFGFWQLAQAAAAAAVPAIIALWLVLYALTFWTRTGAHPWGAVELLVGVSVILVAVFCAAMCGRLARAGGTTLFDRRTAALDAAIWGLVGSLLGTALLAVGPPQITYFAWVRGSLQERVYSGVLLDELIVRAMPLLFLTVTASRAISVWLVDRMPRWERPQLTVVAGAGAAAAATTLIMLVLPALSQLSGELIGVWLLLVTLSFATAAVSATIEMVPFRMRALAARGQARDRLPNWTAVALLALLAAIAARPVMEARSDPASASRNVVVPLPGARVLAVVPEQRLDVELISSSNQYLMVKNADRTFAIAPLRHRRLSLKTLGNSIVICVAGQEDLLGGDTSPWCERPSISWIGDIFAAPSRENQGAVVSIERIPEQTFAPVDFGKQPLQFISDGAATFEVGEDQPTTLMATLAREVEDAEPREEWERPFIVLERDRSDGYAVGEFSRGLWTDNLAGRFRICVRRYISEPAAATSAARLSSGTGPSTYLRLGNPGCDSKLLQPVPMGLLVAVFPSEKSFEASMLGNKAQIGPGDIEVKVEQETILRAEIRSDGDDLRDLVLFINDAEGRHLSAADDPEEIIAYLEPGTYHLCAAELSGPDEEVCRSANGRIAYRLDPLASLTAARVQP